MFRVGQKVVCVDDRACELLPRHQILPWKRPIKKGAVYTISAVGLWHELDFAREHECVALAEVDYPMLLAARFRPVANRKTDISIFQKILREATEKANV